MATAERMQQLGWDEIGLLCYGLSLSPMPLRVAIQDVTAEFDLGPRGAWMLNRIASGDTTPMDLTRVFGIGRSLVTAELTRLTDADLIAQSRRAGDGRRVDLVLTPLGERTRDRVRDGLGRLISERFAHYTVEEVRLCTRMLIDFLGSDVRFSPEDVGASNSRSGSAPA